MISRVIADGLLALSVFIGPVFWLMSAACVYTAFIPNLPLSGRLGLGYAGFVFACWALWGIISGPVRMRGWSFACAALLNIATGAWMLTTERPNKFIVAAVFLGYSLWQFFVFRRTWTYKPAVQ